MNKDKALDLALEFFETMQRYKGTRSNIFIRFEPTATGDYVDLREFDGRAKPIITAIKQARSAPVQEPVKFLANGTRFKTSEFPYGVCINGLPKELSGCWVALVAAEDDCHLKLTTPPAAPVQQKPLFADIIAQHPGLAEELKAMDAAPVQEPVYHLRQFGDVTKEQLDRYMATGDINPQPAPVQELVAFNAGVPLLYPEMKDGETISVEYTTPPAAQPATEVLRLSKDGIWANPDIPADDAAKLVLEAIDHNIKILVQKAVLAEREACAKVCEQSDDDGEGPDCWGWHSKDYATAIRARSKD
jgi:hypothetical protein